MIRVLEKFFPIYISQYIATTIPDWGNDPFSRKSQITGPKTSIPPVSILQEELHEDDFHVSPVVTNETELNALP